jgi:tRNA(Ile)-lysidine synthase
MGDLKLPPQNSFLLAVSGGRDSMVMLDLCARRFFNGNPDQITRLEVASVNHGVRGKESAADLDLVEAVCQKWGIPFHAICLQAHDLQGSGGFESLARNARYAAMLALKQSLGIEFLCTAHHRRDQAETVLLRMRRSTGIPGLRGILPQRLDGVLRPLLHFSSTDLIQYARQHQVQWREDTSNQDMRHARNRVRQLELPALERLFPGAEVQLAELAELAYRVYPKIQQAGEFIFGSLVIHAVQAPFIEVRMNRMALSQSLAGRTELFRIWLLGRGISLDGQGLQALVEQLKHTHGGMDLKGGIRLDCSGNVVRIGNLRSNAVVARLERAVELGANLYLLGWQFRDRTELCGELACTSEVAWLDAESLQGEPVLRTRQDGDRFSPPGLRSKHRKLKKFFHESGIVRADRDSLPVVAFADEVLWVPGHAVSGNYQVHSQTKTVIELRLECRRTTH